MINKRDFKDMLKDMESLDNQRELLIKGSRDVLKLSKQLIYALHRGDRKRARVFATEIKKAFKNVN